MILIIHPLDKSIKRLGRIASYLHRSLQDKHKDNRLFIVHPNATSRSECHEAIRQCSADDLIIFLGHGRSDALYGAKGKYYTSPCAPLPSEDSTEEDYVYNDENLIDKSSHDLFKNKKAIIYACKSSSLAKNLLRSGAQAVYGFGLIPTSIEEFTNFHVNDASALLVAQMKEAITRILKRGFLTALESECSFGQFQRIMEYQFSREISHILMSKFRYKKTLINSLFRVKREMCTEGKIELLL